MVGYNIYLVCTLYPISTGKGGDDLQHDEEKVRGSCNHTLNSRFAIAYNIKSIFGEKNLPRPVRGPEPRVGVLNLAQKFSLISNLANFDLKKEALFNRNRFEQPSHAMVH